MNEVFEELRAALHQVEPPLAALAVAWGVCVLGWFVVAMIPNSYMSRRMFVQLDDVLSEQLDISGSGKEEMTACAKPWRAGSTRKGGSRNAPRRRYRDRRRNAGRDRRSDEIGDGKERTGEPVRNRGDDR